MLVFLVLNTVAALVSVGFAVFAAIRPAALSHAEATVGVRFGAYMYAARAIPFGLVAAVLPWAERGVATAWLLFAAAVVQLVDAGIGGWRREPGMIAGGTVAAVIHTATAIALL
jgi:hypothetical protein